jgi:alpha-1,6-mannosyltransferase
MPRVDDATGLGRRAVPVVLLAFSAAATARLLLVSPAAPADVTFPVLVAAVTSLGAFVVSEHRVPTTSRRAVLGLAGGLLAVAVAPPPHGSHDLWSYAFYGRMLARYHVSPYTHRPAEFPGDPALLRVAPGWREAASVYGPGFTLLSAALAIVAGSSALLARLGYQGIAAVAVLVAGVLLARRQVSAAALAAVVLNPLVVVAVVNGGHNDALVGLALLGGGLALLGRRPVVAGLLVAAAILVKAIAVLPAMAALAWVVRHRGRRPAAVFVGALAVPVVAGYAAFGGLHALEPLLAADAHESRASIWGLLASGHAGVPAALVVVCVTAALVASRVEARSPAQSLAAGLVGYLLVAAYVLPWYFAWVLPLAALDTTSPLSRLLAVQTVTTLVAYQYDPTNHPDALDHVLHGSVTLAQLFALAAAVALLVLALLRPPSRSRDRDRALMPDASSTATTGPGR